MAQMKLVGGINMMLDRGESYKVPNDNYVKVTIGTEIDPRRYITIGGVKAEHFIDKVNVGIGPGTEIKIDSNAASTGSTRTYITGLRFQITD